jgi:predicted Zn-dependent protease with MMP-like domain
MREVETPGEESWSDTLWRALRPVVFLLLVGSCAWLLIDPPSFSGVPTLLLVLLGAVLLTLAMAWVATRMIGEEIPETEWRKIVDRSELLAQLPAPTGPPSAFDELVIAALDDLPQEFQEALEKVPVTVSREGYKYGAYGLYVGATVARDTYPDHIVIFEDTLTRDFGASPELLRAQVQRTVRHELAHHLGWDEEGVRGLGLG